MSEPFQSTTYTRTSFGANYAVFVGDQSGSKIGRLQQPVDGAASIAIQDNGPYTIPGALTISTDSSLLNLLPNRQNVNRVLRINEGFGGSPRFGYAPITLGSAKRLAMRWYAYYSPTYDFAYETEDCTNGKILHNNNGDGWAVSPLVVFQSYGWATNHYDFGPGGIGGGPTPSWLWSGHSSWDGFVGGNGTYGSGGPYPTANWKGNWLRFEFIVKNPRLVDSQVNGYDFEFYIRNITQNSSEVQDYKFSNGCTSCMFINDVPGQNFVWDSSIHPTTDMPNLHTELYRAGTCRGWQAWAYAVVAKWDTDAGQRIGAASEVEGGGVPQPVYDGTMTLTVSSWILVFLYTVMAACVVAIAVCAVAWRRNRRRYDANIQGLLDDLQGDSGEPVWPTPVDGPPPAAGDAVQPVVPDPRADELVGAGRAGEERR